MWYIKNTKSSWFMLVIFLLGIVGCSEQESDIHLFYGEWSVRETTWTFVNGIRGPNFFQFYLIELNSDNCGTKYNLDKEETDSIKWLFNEADKASDHYFLLSIQDTSSEGISNLAMDNLYFVMKLSEEEIMLSRRKERISNDTTFTTIWNLTLTRE